VSQVPEPPREWLIFADWLIWAMRDRSMLEGKALVAASAAMEASNPEEAVEAAEIAAQESMVAEVLDPQMVAFALARATVGLRSDAFAALVPGAVIVRNYTGSPDEIRFYFQRDADRMASQGFAVSAQSIMQGRSGCMRILLLGGIGALLFRPADTLTVTFRKQ